MSGPLLLSVDDLGDALCSVSHNNLDERRTAVPLHRACPLHLGVAVRLLDALTYGPAT